MKITKVNLHDVNGGLAPIKMEKLGSVVLIAGKNGSGKTRLLNNINQALGKKATNDTNHLYIEKANLISTLATQKNEFSLTNDLRYKSSLEQQIAHGESSMEELDKKILTNESIELIGDNGVRAMLPFIPTAHLNDHMNYPPKGLLSHARSAGDSLGVDHLTDSALAKIQHVQNRWREARHPDTVQSPEHQEAIIEYQHLDDSIYAFLGTRLGRSTDSVATLFGQEIGRAHLSKGQIVLLQLCIALHSQKIKLSESIIVLDEPENHLHPEALIDVVDKIQSVLINGQLWIATHSIHLLAHFPPASIWYMKDGTVSYSGKIPEQVLHGLMGGENQVSKLADFLNLPAQMASVQFAFECLFPPFAIDTGTDDPQTSQIIEAIKSTIQSGELKKVLDFGAGQARLLSAIIDTDGDLATPSWLDYFAYDTFDTYKEICEQKIASSYGNHQKRYFLSEQDLIQNTPRKSFDFIVMCNVFHEVDPKDWLIMLSEHGALRSCLSDDGYLLIIEDQLIPIGEKAYKNGFLVFDVEQFKILFNIDSYQFRSKKNDRLKCHFIPSSSLKNVTSETRKKSVENFNQRALERVKNLRTQDANISNGRLHAFWSQQATNSQLVLSELG